MAGLAASRALSPHFEQVVVLDRDRLPDASEPREGVPQGRHPHVLLAGGQRALELLVPGLERGLLALGAVPYRVGLDICYERPGYDSFPRRDLGWCGLAMSRPLLELALRRFEPHDNIEVREGHRYSTAHVRLAAGSVDWLGLMVLPDAPSTSRGATLLPLEDGRSIVLVVGRGKEKPAAGWDGFDAAVAALRTPTLMRALSRAERLDTPTRFAFAASVWRHFERLSRWPRGLLPLGDAICRFNPFYGQGMSVAAQQALLLAELLRERAGHREPIEGLSEAFFARVPALIDAPWALAALPDLVFPDTRGERPADLAARLAFSAALTRLAASDAAVHALTMRVQHLLEPRSALAQPALRERVQRLLSNGARES